MFWGELSISNGTERKERLLLTLNLEGDNTNLLRTINKNSGWFIPSELKTISLGVLREETRRETLERTNILFRYLGLPSIEAPKVSNFELLAGAWQLVCARGFLPEKDADLEKLIVDENFCILSFGSGTGAPMDNIPEYKIILSGSNLDFPRSLLALSQARQVISLHLAQDPSFELQAIRFRQESLQPLVRAALFWTVNPPVNDSDLSSFLLRLGDLVNNIPTHVVWKEVDLGFRGKIDFHDSYVRDILRGTSTPWEPILLEYVYRHREKCLNLNLDYHIGGEWLNSAKDEWPSFRQRLREVFGRVITSQDIEEIYQKLIS